MPWFPGPVTFAAVIVPVMVPEVAAGQAGWPPPPHRNIITPPETFVGAKCTWAKVSGDDSPEKVNEKVIVFPISIWKAPEPAVLIGGTSFPPPRVAEKRSVAEWAAGTAKRLAVSAVITQIPIFLVFIIVFVPLNSPFVSVKRNKVTELLLF
jgi:hypothetical protein